tara:strand:+ start:1721 stop:2089 length:369 start_codon:yes stop_codon:yes gene_type:complete
MEAHKDMRQTSTRLITDKIYKDFFDGQESEYWDVLKMSDPDIQLNIEILDFIDSQSYGVAYEYASEFLDQVDWYEIVQNIQDHYFDSHCGNCGNELYDLTSSDYCSNKCEEDDLILMTRSRV